MIISISSRANPTNFHVTLKIFLLEMAQFLGPVFLVDNKQGKLVFGVVPDQTQ